MHSKPPCDPSLDGEVLVGEGPLSLDALIRVAVHGARVRLPTRGHLQEHLGRSRQHLASALESGTAVYGVTTGFGANCGSRFSREQSLAVGASLLRFHGCGVGPALPIEAVRAAMLTRIQCFMRGYSGVGEALVLQLAAFLNAGITPVVPALGSVGASGDLTPMSYVAAALAGEREVFFRDERMPAARALEAAGLAAHRFEPKEPLSLMNGTAAMTGVAIVVADRCRRIQRAATRATALAQHALLAHEHHLHAALFEAKPFPGQSAVAAELRHLMDSQGRAGECEAPDALQDAYSLRCAPHVIGVLADALLWIERWIVIEANSATDNPLFDPASGRPLMGGNFYGGHIAFAMDALKGAVASVADLCDRQVAWLVDARTNRGLPANLSPAHTPAGAAPGHTGPAAPRHGFKAAHIACSALTAEALQATMPAASFSRSTESHNQDKVSMGSIAARDALRVVELVEHVLAIALMVGAQGCELRGTVGVRPAIRHLVDTVRRYSSFLTDDRCLDAEIASLAEAIARGPLGDEGDGRMRTAG